MRGYHFIADRHDSLQNDNDAPLIIPVGLSVAALVSPGDSPISLTDFLGLIVLFFPLRLARGLCP